MIVQIFILIVFKLLIILQVILFEIFLVLVFYFIEPSTQNRSLPFAPKFMKTIVYVI